MEPRPVLLDQLASIELSDGRTANCLLSEFFRGRPLADLIPALQSNNDRVVKHAAWIASELGEQAVELLQFVSPLLRHESHVVRSLALEVVLNCASSEDGAALAMALNLLTDESAWVRRQACHFCARAAQEQLESGIRQLTQESPVPIFAAFSWLVTPAARDAERVREFVKSANDVQRILGILAAARMGRAGVGILASTDPSQDEGVRGFILDWLELPHRK